MRAAFVLKVPVKPISGRDHIAYEELALNIIYEGVCRSHEGYAQRTPLYPYFVAAVYAAFGKNPRNVFIAQAFLGAMAVTLLFWILRRLSPEVAWTGAAIASVHPVLLFYTEQILAESLHMVLLLLLAYWALRLMEGASRAAVPAGVVMGLVILCRPEATILAAFFMAGIYLFYPGRRRERARTLAVCAASTFLVLAPWLARNYRLLGSPVLITKVGLNFYIAHNPKATGDYIEPEIAPPASMGEVEGDRFYLRQGIAYIRAHPLSLPGLIVKKNLSLWAPNRNFVLDFADMLVWPISILGMVLALRDSRRRPLYYFLASPIAAILLSVSICIGTPRYRAPLTPFSIAFAAIALVFMFDRVAHWSSRARPRRFSLFPS